MKPPAAAAVLLAAALAGGAAPPPRRAPPAGPCASGETLLYACAFGRKQASVCAAPGRIAYRFGPRGRPELTIASTPDWSNIHLGGNRSQGGLNQDHVRFTNGDTHYVVHAGYTGSLSEEPGRRYSGITVLRGAEGREIAALGCARPPASSSLSSAGDFAPEGWDGEEAADGPFDVIY